MARYKIIDRSPRFLPLVLEAQLMSGRFEYVLNQRVSPSCHKFKPCEPPLFPDFFACDIARHGQQR